MTIYEQVLAIHQSSPDISEFHSLVDEKLSDSIVLNFIKIFKTVYQFDITADLDSFVCDEVTIEKDCIEIIYTFKYGIASLSILNLGKNDESFDLFERFAVSFSFSDESPNPLYNDLAPIIDVDNNMALVKAEFSRVFEYVDSIFDRSLRLNAWAVFFVDITIDSAGNRYISFRYQNKKMYDIDETKKNRLFFPNLDYDLFNASDDFYLLLFRYLQLNSYQPKAFYEVFSEKKDYLEIINDSKDMIEGLTMFCNDYIANKEMLVSRLSVLEMRLI